MNKIDVGTKVRVTKNYYIKELRGLEGVVKFNYTNGGKVAVEFSEPNEQVLHDYNGLCNTNCGRYIDEEYLKPPHPIDLNTQTPTIVTEDIKVRVWNDDKDNAVKRYLYSIDHRSKTWPFVTWHNGMTGKECNYNSSIISWKHAEHITPEPEQVLCKINKVDMEKLKEIVDSIEEVTE